VRTGASMNFFHSEWERLVWKEGGKGKGGCFFSQQEGLVCGTENHTRLQHRGDKTQSATMNNVDTFPDWGSKINKS